MISSESFLSSINDKRVYNSKKYGVYVGGVSMPNVHLVCVEDMSDGGAFRIIEYNNVLYRQNGYVQSIRGNVTHIFNEQDWFIVVAETKVSYEYR